MPSRSLRVVPLGGLGEIGKNMLALEYGDDILVIDAGVQFAGASTPGIDLIIPDVTYLLERRSKVRAILITHGHEDHIGAIPYLLRQMNVPIYAPRLAHGLISVKLKEHRIRLKPQLVAIEPGKSYRLGNLSVEWFRVAHSIPDAMGIAIRTPLGWVVHTGDFKIDHTPIDGHTTDFAALARYAAEGVFLLHSDSTYAELPGYTPSETVVGEALDRAIGEAPGRVMVATFASLISRVQYVINAAHHHGRKVAVLGRSMADNVKMALDMGYLKAPPGALLSYPEVRHLPKEKVVIVMTGSQGEPTSALVRIANRDHREITIGQGDTVVISASPIPGNETAVYDSINNLYRQGAQVIYQQVRQVHVHGHASQEELKMVLNLVRPKYFVPVHGEYRHLVAHAELAKALGIPADNIFVLQDGDVLELSPKEGRLRDRVEVGPVYVDGLRLWDINSVVLRDRQLLSRDGIVMAILTVDKRSGHLAREPELVSSGFIEQKDAEELFRGGTRLLMTSLDHGTAFHDRRFLDTKVKESLGKYLHDQTGRRPMIIPVTVEV